MSTAEGAVVDVVVESPSWPKLFRPQQRRESDEVMPHCESARVVTQVQTLGCAGKSKTKPTGHAKNQTGENKNRYVRPQIHALCGCSRRRSRSARFGRRREKRREPRGVRPTQRRPSARDCRFYKGNKQKRGTTREKENNSERRDKRAYKWLNFKVNRFNTPNPERGRRTSISQNYKRRRYEMSSKVDASRVSAAIH